MTTTTTPAGTAGPSTFKEENRALQELVREWKVTRLHNLELAKGTDRSTLLLFAEGALVCMVFEHFVRMVIEKNYPGECEGRQLRGLLDFAMTKERDLFRLPFTNPENGKQAVCDHRNALLHGNFAQAARQAGCTSVEQYFGERFASEIEAMTKIVDFVFLQIDPSTGAPRAKPPRA